MFCAEGRPTIDMIPAEAVGAVAMTAFPEKPILVQVCHIIDSIAVHTPGLNQESNQATSIEEHKTRGSFS